MKIYKLLTLLALPLALAFTACSDEEADYKKAGVPSNAQVYFANDISSDILLEEGQSVVKILVSRSNTQGEITVPVSSVITLPELEDEDGNPIDSNIDLKVPETVTFKDGEATAEIVITFDGTKVVSDTPYIVNLKLESENTPYGFNEREFTISYSPWSQVFPAEPLEFATDEEWEEYVEENAWQIGKYEYTGLISGTYDQPVFYRYSLTNPDKVQYMLYDWFYGVNLIINADLSEKDEETGIMPVYVEPQYSGYSSSNYGACYVCDAVYYFHNLKGNPDITYETPGYQSYYDENLGVMVLNLTYFVSLGGGAYGYFASQEEYLYMPWYTKTDYTVTVTPSGNYLSPSNEEGEVVNFVLGGDVSKVKYGLYNGEIDESTEEGVALLDEVADAVHFGNEYEGLMEVGSTTDNGDHVFIISEAGTYTVVAITYDMDGKRQLTVAEPFEFTPLKGWSDVWQGDYTYTVVFTADEEGTPYVDEGLITKQNNEEKSSFKIMNWGYGVEFKFSFVPGGDVEVAYQPTGYEEEGYGPVYVQDIYALTGSEEYAGKSSYDEATGTFTFAVYYPIVGTQYSYGYGQEFYKITDTFTKARVDAAYHAAKKMKPIKVTKKPKKVDYVKKYFARIQNKDSFLKHLTVKF